MRRWSVLIVGVALLAITNYAIYSKERLLTAGRVVLLELAPVDPRSLLQGDYMALRFKVADAAFGRGKVADGTTDGHIVLRRDANGVAEFSRFDDGTPLAVDEVRMRYRIRNARAQFATNAFFFQEGDGGRYAAARYGEFRVGDDGEAILTHLREAPDPPSAE